MSLRSVLPLLAALVLGCGGSTSSSEPTTAKEKQRREAKANGEDVSGSKSWGGWRYKGDRNACFYSFSGKCFKTEPAACAAAKCGKKKCTATGGGPAIIACK